MAGYKYFKFMVDNDGDPTRIAKAMKRLDVNLASELDVSLIMYGLRFHHASGKAILEGCVHFYDEHDGNMRHWICLNSICGEALIMRSMLSINSFVPIHT